MEQRGDIMSSSAFNRGSLLVQQGKLFVLAQNAGSISTAGFGVNPANGAIGSPFLFGFGINPDTNSITNLASGHDGSAFFIQNGAGATRIMHGSVDQNHFSSTFTLPSGVVANSLAVVVAPEPASMVALAGGVALLLRRRKSR